MRIDEIYDKLIAEAVERAYAAGYKRGYAIGHRDATVEALCRVGLSKGNAVNNENKARGGS
ncbi:hypothetical protein [Paenibacillus chibensis]|uniref:hypothetical protein n=1 Tax=Paenibacillus chibensis TaxID=59846 RepID=UPI000FDCB55F|nr:hypothetical protein [Paenibacillus chibensis]MEC0370025.1 hypothetical protein [Paenibacillus chibensis]